METLPGYWKLVNDYLLTTKLLGTELVDLARLFDLGSLSPLPPEISKIDMVESFRPKQFMENIVRNILDQRLRLTVSMWRDIREIYRVVEYDATPSRQKVLQVLLTATKLDATEFYKVYWKQPMPDATSSHVYERIFLRNYVLDSLKAMVTYESIGLADDDVSKLIKAFLLRPAIIAAFRDSLVTAGLNKDDSWICDSVNSMQISCTDGLEAFNGFALRDGILLIGARPHFRKLVTDGGYQVFAKDRAKILTVACHEASHFLARCAAGDFNYSSPGKGESEKKFDRVEEGKHLELGRNVELLLFGNIQPTWASSSTAAAVDFLTNVDSMSTYPLVREDPGDSGYLVKRQCISLSFAADLKDMEFEFDL